MSTQNYIPIIDSGHGYNTTGKQSKGFYNPDGTVELKENSVNEAVANKLSMVYYLNDKEAKFISNEWNDISLSERVRREHGIYDLLKAQNKTPLFLSLHADAFRIKNGAKGGRFFYFSDSGRVIAEQLTNYLRTHGYDIELREPKRANFKVLRETHSPAVLFEMGFMTTREDLDKLKSDDFRNKTAKLLYDAIENLY